MMTITIAVIILYFILYKNNREPMVDISKIVPTKYIIKCFTFGVNSYLHYDSLTHTFSVGEPTIFYAFNANPLYYGPQNIIQLIFYDGTKYKCIYNDGTSFNTYDINNNTFTVPLNGTLSLHQYQISYTDKTEKEKFMLIVGNNVEWNNLYPALEFSAIVQ